MRVPRWRGGKKKNQQVRLDAATIRQLRTLSAVLDESCPSLVRLAIANLIVKYDAGGERQPILLPSQLSAINQQTVIQETDQEKLRQFAFEQKCYASDLVREAISDLLRHHQKGEQP